MAGGGGATTTSRSLQETPTWALATVCFIFISLSIFVEHSIQLLCHWLKRRRKTALLEAVEKLKSVLILLGFMSLILAVSQRGIAKICVPKSVAYTMLPCRRTAVSTKTTKTSSTRRWTASTGFSYDGFPWRSERILDASDGGDSDYCSAKGMASLISQEGVTQLSIFIFILAVMQIVSSVLTMALGRAKMRRWKTWEKETQTVEYQAANDPNRFRYTRQTTFGRRHTGSWTEMSIHLWIKCFFRQFFHSVAKVDYCTLRHGFISAHLSTNNSFNFRKYIQRSLEDDFKVVVGISPVMWLWVVILMLLDIRGWHVYLLVSFIPLIIVLVLGTKLEAIVARMAIEIQEKNDVIKGTPLVQPNDKLFWFSHPKYVLTLLHYTLFMNAFELAFFFWITVQFGIKSCYLEHVEIIVIRVVLAIMVQVLCSYITLPLYALVTQMGSHFKSAVLEHQTANAIKEWHADARRKRKKQKDQYNSHHTKDDDSSTVWTVDETSSSPDVSSHHRTLTFADINSFPENQFEITEVSQDSNQDLVPTTIVPMETPIYTTKDRSI